MRAYIQLFLSPWRQIFHPQPRYVYEDLITGPLWGLMLSTNSCYPGCSCDNDYFDMSKALVQAWASRVGTDTVGQAAAQLEAFLNNSSLDFRSLSMQTNYSLENEAEARTWLKAWKDLVDSV